jgi:hypothetical protein
MLPCRHNPPAPATTVQNPVASSSATRNLDVDDNRRIRDPIFLSSAFLPDGLGIETSRVNPDRLVRAIPTGKVRADGVLVRQTAQRRTLQATGNRVCGAALSRRVHTAFF